MPSWLLIMVFFCISALGVVKAEKLKRRQTTLNDCHLFFQSLRREISYHHYYIDQHISQYVNGKSGLFSVFLGEVSQRNGSFQTRFKSVLDMYHARLVLSKTDVFMLEEFADIVGSTSMTEQLRHLDFLVQYVEIELEALKGRIDQDVHLYIISSMLMGGLIIILLL